VILGELEPAVSTDAETVGLWGAIHKRLWDLTGEQSDLDTALLSYEKGFYIRNDYYNGINLAYLYNLRSSITSGSEAEADFVMARRIRTRVLTICDAWLKAEEERQKRSEPLIRDSEWMENEEKRWAEEKYWVLATNAEASAGLGDDVAAEKFFDEAKALNPAAFMVEGTQAQIIALKGLLDKFTKAK
jgi:hypothetical protein